MAAREHVPLVVVAALGRNGVIGHEGGLPWRMPVDLARFRELTTGTPMIMGRRTWESIGKPLPGRESIVVSRDAALALPAGVLRAESPEAAMDVAEARARAMDAASISLIGGAALFAALMSQADRLALTYVDLEPAGDTFFPEIDPPLWREASRIVPPRHPQDDATCVFVDLVRREG